MQRGVLQRGCSQGPCNSIRAPAPLGAFLGRPPLLVGRLQQPPSPRRWRHLPPRATTQGSGSPHQPAPLLPVSVEPQVPPATQALPTRPVGTTHAPASSPVPSSTTPSPASSTTPSAPPSPPFTTPASSSSTMQASSDLGSLTAPQRAPIAVRKTLRAQAEVLSKKEEQQQQQPPPGGFGTFWGLLVLSLAYLHHSTTAFALPSLLPIITEDLALTDSQGALLTVGYTVLYALTMVLMGLLADRVDRPRLLSLGIGLWSVLTIAASQAHGFGQLLATRVGFAAAQATQNPVCFSLIPELFPNGRTTAMAFYNSAIYAGRALSFAAVIIAAQLGVPEGRIGDIGYTVVPLDKVDLSLVSVLYTQGDFAAITPVYTYAISGEDGAMPPGSPLSGWRQLLGWLGPPGLALAVLCLLTVDEPRTAGTGGFLGDPLKSSRFLNQPSAAAAAAARRGGVQRPAPPGPASESSAKRPQQAQALAPADVAAAPAAAPPSATSSAGDHAGSLGDSLVGLRQLLASPKFQAITFACAINDIGGWALVSWQATFYQRVYHLSPDVYAPLLAVVIPIGGIIGGVGAGALGDWLNRVRGRHVLTAVCNCMAAPTIALSLLAPDYRQSFAALLVGFALSEAWRAPAAVMVREVSPPGLGSASSAVHLCIRNLVGGLGPIFVAYLSGRVGLQTAMLLVPTCFLLSGLGFGVAEVILRQEDKDREPLAPAAAVEGGGKAG